MLKRGIHKIDATGKVLGRLSTQIAILLRGKHKPDFVLNQDTGDFVYVKNVDKIKFTGKKFNKKIYYRHTGYLGGLKKATMAEIFKKNPGRILRMSAYGMLPPNKLRARQIQRLKIK